MDSPSPLDNDFKGIKLMPAVLSNNKSPSTAAPLPSTSPDPSNPAGLAPHTAIADLRPTATMSPGHTFAAKRTFAAMAKKVIIQERIRKAEEEDAAAEDEGKNFLYFLYYLLHTKGDLFLLTEGKKSYNYVAD